LLGSSVSTGNAINPLEMTKSLKAELIAAQEARLDREFPNGFASAPG
jgi:hypothetical protein